jgi:hypothetical protein
MDDEQYVRERYPEAIAAYSNQGMTDSHWVVLVKPYGDELVRLYSGALCGEGPVWEKARAFTEEREKQIAEVNTELNLLYKVGNCGFDTKQEVAAFNRIFAREQAALDELKRGLKA